MCLFATFKKFIFAEDLLVLSTGPLDEPTLLGSRDISDLLLPLPLSCGDASLYEL